MKGRNELRFCKAQMIEIVRHWIASSGGDFSEQEIVDIVHHFDMGTATFVVSLDEPKKDGGA